MTWLPLILKNLAILQLMVLVDIPSSFRANAGIVQGGYTSQDTQVAVDSKHVVHVALTDGLNVNWPFGNSILESIFKVYKQKELLEDSIIIYRVQRAPERRVFYIDVGNMPAHKAMSFVERVKNEVHQTRIPKKLVVVQMLWMPLIIHLVLWKITVSNSRR